MEITNEQRDQAYETATPEQKYLYADPESGQKMYDIANKHNIVNDEQYNKYAMIVGDVVLNLRKRSDLPALLSNSLGISSEKATSIATDLIDFLDRKPIQNTEIDLSVDIAETEASLKAVPRIRTMMTDMDKVQTPGEKVYSSTQEAILKDSKPAVAVMVPVPLPRPTAPPTSSPPPIPKPQNFKKDTGSWG